MALLHNSGMAIFAGQDFIEIKWIVQQRLCNESWAWQAGLGGLLGLVFVTPSQFDEESGTGVMRRGLLLVGDTPNRESGVTAVGAGREDGGTVDVQIVRDRFIARRRRPVVADAALSMRGAIVVVAGEGKTRDGFCLQSVGLVADSMI